MEGRKREREQSLDSNLKTVTQQHTNCYRLLNAELVNGSYCTDYTRPYIQCHVYYHAMSSPCRLRQSVNVLAILYIWSEGCSRLRHNTLSPSIREAGWR